jgi:dipeptidyl-peptidase-4
MNIPWLYSVLILAAFALIGMTGCAPKPSVSDTSSGKTPMIRDTAFLEQYAATRGFTHGTPKNISITPDGSAVLFLRSGPRSFVQDLYEVNTATGKERVLLTADQLLNGKEEHLTAEELARRERMRLASRGIASYILSQDGQRILVPLSGKLFVMQRADGMIAELTSAAGYPIDPQFSPDGHKVACVRDGDLYVINVANGLEQRLTSKTSPTITNGLAEFVAQEEMARFHGFWWSPDSQSICFEQADTSGMETFHIADPVSPDKEAQSWPYPRPGKRNATARLFVTAAKTGGSLIEVRWDHNRYEYLAKVTWSTGAPLCLLVMNRAQTDWALLEADPATSSTRELLKEHDDAWLNLSPSNPRWLKDGSGFLWMTERTGAWQLELRARDGSLTRVLTPSSLGLEGITGIAEREGIAYILAGANPTETHIYRVSMKADGDPPRCLTDGIAGRHGLTLADESGAWVESSAFADGRSTWTIVGHPKSAEVAIACTREAPPWVPHLELTTVGPKSFHAAIIRPRDFDAKKRYPVIVNVYGGPHAKTVNATPQSYFLQQWIADQGFIIVCIDGRGTPGRGRDWERAIKNELIDPALDDQVEGLKALGAKHPEMNLAHVGIYGWSFGGYFSAMAAMKRPDIYHAGCAGAPVCDWLDYDTCYTERYLGVPALNKDGAPDSDIYAKNSVLTYCKDLRRPLLIIHGTADDNVYFMHSLKMTQSLFRAGKEFEFLPLAGFTHMVPDPVVTTRLYSRIAMFFKEHLGEPTTR